MIALVGMGGSHVLPLAAMPEVVHHVGVLVGVNDRIMGVLLGYPALLCCACGNLLAAPGRAGAADPRQQLLLPGAGVI